MPQLSAVVTPQKPDAKKAAEFGLKYFHEEPVYIIILIRTRLEKWQEKLGFYHKELSYADPSLNLDITHHMMEKLGLRRYAYIETYPHGASIEEYADVYEDGEMITFWASINKALEMLGVQKKEGMDESEVVNLEKYKHTGWIYP